MEKKGLSLTPHDVPKTNGSVWWYEERGGIDIVISNSFTAGSSGRIVRISKRALEGYFKRLRSLRRP